MSHRILLCDDEVHILRAAEFKLKKAGYDVQTAKDGEEGWEAIQNGKPEVVITDIQMPRLDGIGLIRRMREHPETADMPAFLLTAKGFQFSQERLSHELGIRHIFHKPFSPWEILQEVEMALQTEAVGV